MQPRPAAAACTRVRGCFRIYFITSSSANTPGAQKPPVFSSDIPSPGEQVLLYQQYFGNYKCCNRTQTRIFQRKAKQRWPHHWELGTSRQIPAWLPHLCPPPQYRCKHSTQAAREAISGTWRITIWVAQENMKISFLVSSAQALRQDRVQL